MKATIFTTSCEVIEVTRTAESVRLGFRVLGCAQSAPHRLWVADDGRMYVKARGVWMPVKLNTFDPARADRRFNEGPASDYDPAKFD